MDDITIHTNPKPEETEEQHQKQHETLTHLVLDILEENNLYLKPEKCKFLQTEIVYLGVIIGNNKIKWTQPN